MRFFMGHNEEIGLGRIWYGDFTDASGGDSRWENRFKFFIEGIGFGGRDELRF